jgi:LmbE family N-acetylglucosaminyl deacetylase
VNRLSCESCRGSSYRSRVLLLTAALLSSCATGPDAHPAPMRIPSQELVVQVAERMLLIAPHPDDETLAAAGLSQRVLTRIGSVRTLVLTGGEAMLSAMAMRAGKAEPSRDALASYAALRQREARQAARVLGRGAIRLQHLGFPDRGLLPFGYAPDPQLLIGAGTEIDPVAAGGNPFALSKLPATAKALQASIVRALRESPPTLVVFPDPLDAHRDHRAAGLFTLLAVREYMRGREAPWPRMLAYLVHWNGWPPGSHAGSGELPRNAALELPATLPPRGQPRLCLPLNPRELDRKREALDSYQSQRELMPEFMNAFARSTECFSENTPLDAELTAVRMRPAALGRSATLEPSRRR